MNTQRLCKLGSISLISFCLLIVFSFAGIASSEDQTGTTEKIQETSTAPAPIIVPAGTRMLVRMDNTIDSRQHGVGHMFTVTLDMNLAVNGKVLAPKGSKLYGRLTQAKQSGRLAGKSELLLQLSDIMINDIPHPIVSSGLKAVTENTAGSTAGSAAGGAVVGGLWGGSKGAKRGAAVGLAGSLLTSGNTVHIPTGTVLEFTLQADLTYVP
ncbi:MAG: hypothetical protein HF978_14930 [Desulfobacteraceae bacterium]|nr:hypothetical protein [Desulfobacteraceae bacterium]MBC2756834.1 hypothetical protein [Desulfobacteraceae bacterium]